MIMEFIVEAFFSGCISKVINDGKDYSWTKIKGVINDKHNCNLSTKIYRVIERALNIITIKKFKGTDVLYQAIEKIFIGFRDSSDTLESVKNGLCLLDLNVSEEGCENFLNKFYEGLRQNDDLYKEILMRLQQNGIKINQEEFQKLNEKLDDLIDIASSNNIMDIQDREPTKSRTQEYANKWNANMFLNNFDKRDENAGVNVKLREVYLDEHLPHYIWGDNRDKSTDLKELLSEYIEDYNDNKMLIILGQPGIGKSTLITWITANFNERIDDILVYQFASDLGNIDWQNDSISNRILDEIGLKRNDLNGKIFILDGFDEVSIESNKRGDILDSLYGDWIYDRTIENFSLIITCRENYVQRFAMLKCKYITLQSWNEVQIKSFCSIFQEKTKGSISDGTLNKLLENRDILGIPLILYMVLALNIPIEKEESIVNVYDKIFSLDGGIYDRCIDNKSFADKHRIAETKKQIHQVSREISIWMFENKPDEAYIPYEEYKEICTQIKQKVGEKENDDVEKDFVIGNFFRLKHCEGEKGEKLYFVHRSIYEYFVMETIYSSIEKSIKVLSEESQEELAANIAIYLKQGGITYTIREYLLCKIRGLFIELSMEKKNRFYGWWEEAVAKMMDKGMFYYTNKNINYYENIISKECQCFKNIFKILRLFLTMCNEKYVMGNINRKLLEKSIKYCLVEIQFISINNTPTDLIRLDFNHIDLHEMNLTEIELKKIYLNHANLSGVNLKGVDLKGKSLIDVDLTKANLKKINLEDANLEESDLRFADLHEANLNGANLMYTKFDEEQITYLTNCDLSKSLVYVEEYDRFVDYLKYQKMKNDNKIKE